MKTLGIFLTTLLLITSCGGKNSKKSTSASGAGIESFYGKILTKTEFGFDYELIMNSDGSYVFTETPSGQFLGDSQSGNTFQNGTSIQLSNGNSGVFGTINVELSGENCLKLMFLGDDVTVCY